jgi:UDP-glucose 4-epimerase
VLAEYPWSMSVLVTGGAGYIGSHVARLLTEAGTEAIVVDDLSTGKESRVSGLQRYRIDLAEASAVGALEALMRKHKVVSVIHLAALKQVGVSVENPEEYFNKNLGGQANLLLAMRSAGVTKLVFSSSAAAYGVPDVDLVSEDEATSPINPYGQTKLIGEWMAANAETAWGLRYVSLRYFNVAGAGWNDLADTEVLNLIPIVFEAIKNKSKPKVFGSDYNTPDGSCIRDYVHVLDLAQAHIQALDYLEASKREFNTFNVGTGQGYSVLGVIKQIQQTTGIDFAYEVVSRRAGDPARLIADASRIEKTMGWKAKSSLVEIIESAWKALS